MDSWILRGIKNLVKEDQSFAPVLPTQVKVKISHLLLSDHDALLYDGKIETSYPRILGHAAVGIVTEAGQSCYGVEKGTRVFLEPSRPCGECLMCRSGKPKKCTSVLNVGRDFDGFLRDFVVCEYTDVAPLPSTVDDIHALCIETIGIAENIYDKLNLSAGQKVAVIGADFYGNIIAQVLQYHKIIPIVIDNSPSHLERARKCGIYHAYAADDELGENVRNATSGNLCDAAVYCAGSRLPLTLPTRLVRENSTLVLGFYAPVNATISAQDVLQKNLTVYGVSNAYEYTDSVINMLVHGAVNTDYFEKEVLTEYDPAALLAERCADGYSSKKGKMTVLKMIL